MKSILSFYAGMHNIESKISSGGINHFAKILLESIESEKKRIT